MDDLFRKAAENYPLKPAADGWEQLSQKIPARPLPARHQKRNWKKYLPGLLLLFVSLLLSNSLFRYYSRHSLARFSEDSQLVNTAKPSGSLSSGLIPMESSGQKEKAPVVEEAFHSIPGIATKPLKKKLNGLSSIETISEKNWWQHREIVPLLQAPISHQPNIKPDTSKTILAPGAIPTTQKTDNPDGWYAGVGGGFNLSEVRSQGMTKAGFNLGFLVGYRFRHRLSVESGIMRSQKKYYTDGKYFSMHKVGPSMPADMDIVSLDGQMTVLEIPVKIRYDVLRRTNSAFFATGGAATNIYISEKNKYLTEMNGVREQQTSLYKDVSASWFSTVQASLGYEIKTAGTLQFRIEPFAKIPLKKAGVGSLPITTTGINIAVTKPLGKQ